MAITVTLLPAAKQVAYRPVIIEATSDRDGAFVYTVTVTSSGTGGKARYAMATQPVVGDIVTGSGFTGASVVYNVRQTVMVVVTGGSGYIETDLAFVTGATGSGTMTRTNDAFQLKGETRIYDEPLFTIASIIYDTASTIRITLTAIHGYSAGMVVLVSGTTDYNGIFTILSIPSTYAFIITEVYTSNQAGQVRRYKIVGSKRQSAILINSVATFRFSIDNFLRTSLAPDLISNIGANIYTPTLNAIKWYSLHLTEEFDDKDGLLKTGDENFSTEKQAIRAALQHLETQNLNAFLTPATTRRFLTNAPKTQVIRVGEEVQLSFITDNTPLRIAYEQFNLAGVSLGVAYLNQVTIIDGRGIAPVNSNVFNSAHSKVVIWLDNTAPLQVSEKRTFVMDSKCYPKSIRVLFENTLGGFDAYTFTGAYKEITSNKKTNFKKDLGITFAISDRGDTTLGIDADSIFEIYSDLLTNETGVWLSELLNSPNVFIQSGADYIPIIILNTSETIYDITIPIQIKLQYKYANNLITISN